VIGLYRPPQSTAKWHRLNGLSAIITYCGIRRGNRARAMALPFGEDAPPGSAWTESRVERVCGLPHDNLCETCFPLHPQPRVELTQPPS
jgi:hypothetical protein